MVATTIRPNLRRTTLTKPHYLRLARMLMKAIPIIPGLPTLLIVFHRITVTATEGDDGCIIINSSVTITAAAKGITLHLVKMTF